MNLAGVGRILIWQGGSLWIGRSGEPTDIHSHHAVQISISFTEANVEFRRQGVQWHGYKAAIVAAHQPHAFRAVGGLVAMLFVEPETREGKVLQESSKQDGICAVPAGSFESGTASLFVQYQQGAPDAGLILAAQAVIRSIAATSLHSVENLDARIARVLDVIRHRINDNISMSEMAQTVFLSPDRFRHLFMEETGIRFRSYILWLRIEVALKALSAGQNLTDASHEGGFADSAHFSRTFKRMFGIAPSSFLFE